MTPDANDDGESSPEYTGDVEVNDMTDQKDRGPGANSQASNGHSTASMNAKDPLRPRRKKARRACFACQRAHLTCGDERPCQRCIKRGLQDACHDGVRKKAKYLHDAPNEALMPGIGANNFSHMHHVRNTSLSESNSASDASPVYSQQRSFNPQTQTAYGMFPNSQVQGPMLPPLQEGTLPFSTQQSPISPSLASGTVQQPMSMQSLANSMPQSSLAGQIHGQNAYGNPLFDPSDPALFNFDLASLNFGNHYGALEFGMLGHMSSGAAETPPDNNSMNGPMSQGQAPPPNTGLPTPVGGSSGYSGSPNNHASFMYGPNPISNEWKNDWQASGHNGEPRRESGGVPYPTNYNIDSPNRVMNQNGPHAYAIGAGPSSLASPTSSSSPQGVMTGYDGSPINSSFYPNNINQHPNKQNRSAHPQHQQQSAPTSSKLSTPNLQPSSVLGKRPRDPSTIYDTVKQPYSYTTGFHSLTAFLQRRFSPQKTLRIAKALASIRPSFISCTKTLNRDDLIFMEKCFQRTLWEYEDFINACGTPTIVCRRTGEVAAVGKEFSILTGWRKDVLLGKEANLNVNTGGTSGHASAGGSSRGGVNTPRLPDGSSKPEDGNSRPQPVFLAELLDDDSVIEFYEDFARLAFGDSRGSVTTRCKLLKYQTKDERSSLADVDNGRNQPMDFDLDPNSRQRKASSGPQQQQHQQQQGQQQHRKRNSNGKMTTNATNRNLNADISGEAGMNALGVRDGKVECSYCWTVKRDVFDIPMLIVMNFLPCI
ncbi:MAG: Transcriptional regulator of nonfermentable carbon utilization [Pycnora praestabilis]|nr:MAG: Transcriptional regulator of nonfermentable carbon utilization [Pycnora praestabilis]